MVAEKKTTIRSAQCNKKGGYWGNGRQEDPESGKSEAEELLMKIKIDEIKIGDRYRKDMGNIAALADSIDRNGLLQSVAITPDKRLIDGLRRVTACRHILGWDEIGVHMVDIEQLVRGECDANVERKAFTPSEAVAISYEIEKLEKEQARQRQQKAGTYGKEGGRGNRKNPPGKFPEGLGRSENRALDIVAAKIGMSRPTLTKARQVVAAATEDMAKYGDLPKQMDRTGKIHASFVEVKKRKGQEETARKAAQAIKSLEHKVYHADNMFMIHDGTIYMICTDPPYNISRNRVVTFNERKDMTNNFGEWDRMPREEYLEKIKQWTREFYRVLREGGSLYVFCAEQYISHYREALEAVGFTIKNVLVWHFTNPKPKPDKTSYVASADYVIFAVKGSGHTFHWTRHNEMHSVFECGICMGNERRDHPTQKPLKVISRFIKTSSNPGDIVLDPFAGSGTVGEACMKLKRRFILIEQKMDYIRIIEERTGVQHERL